MISIIPLTGMGEVAPGADVAALLEAALGAAAYAPAPGDVLVVTQKILSKAEDRFVALEAVTPSVRAFELAEATRKDPRLVELVLQESSAIVRAAPGVLITRHRVGFVAANAGIDRSNLGPGRAA
ncbi:MAG TPA: coenzyme F420-0:L-glutamate ligase, partial [Terricaulis sp.]|nr:coenzyme F420-0:L-glutamate ligase [Terricaulis sp.]